MYTLTLATFLFALYGLGRGALALGGRRHGLDALWLSPVVGLAVVPLTILALRVLRLPLDHRIVLALAAAGALVPLLQRGVPAPPVSWGHFGAGAAAAAIAAALAVTMYAGATRYPYLEDDDPWLHAVGARYVALHRTTAQPTPRIFPYLEPYPPYYTGMMGLVHQANDDLRWVLKSINAIVIGLSVLAAFHAFQALSGGRLHAVVAAAILAASPAYMSHFIWAQTLAIPVFLAALWALSSLGDTPRPVASGRFWLAALLVWSATIVQLSTAAVFALLLVSLGAVAAVSGWRRERRVAAASLAVLAGGALSFATWAGFAAAYGGPRQMLGTVGVLTPGVFAGTSNVDTSGGVVYSLREIVFPPLSDKIDQSTGLGWGSAALAAAAIVAVGVRCWRERRAPRPADGTMLLWLCVGLLGIEGNALPVRLYPHRFWVFLAIPVAYLAATAVVAPGALRSWSRWRWGAVAGLAALAVGPSLRPRASMQLAEWPPGSRWTSVDQLQAYNRLSDELPRWTRVLPLCNDDALVIGLNLEAEPWDPELVRLRSELGTATAERVLAFLRDRRYDYVIVDDSCVLRLGAARAEELWTSLFFSGAFRPRAVGQGVAILERIVPGA